MPVSPVDSHTDLRTTAAAVAARVETAMHADLDLALAGCDPLLTEVLHYALFNGGKRIRPLLTVLSARCCGRDDDRLYLLAAAFEYLHVATLIHDDVIDRAPRRRGLDTVATRFGLAAAILAGDWLHARSMHLIGRLTGAEGLEVFCRATSSMVNGEFEQLRLVGDLEAGEEEYFKVIRQKTGNLIGSACVLGALFAGADGQRQRALATYGDHIGTAFQVVDDLLDFRGDQQATGKQTGNDFAEGKITLPLLHTLARATPEERHTLAALFAGDRTEASYRQLVALIEHHDGFTSTADVARQLIETAIASLAPFGQADETQASVALLRDLAGYILTRTR